MSSIGIDVSQIPELIGEFIGLPPAVAGTILAVAITIGILVAMTILKVKSIGLAIAGVGVLAIFTVIGWFDPWIMVIIALIAAVLIGDFVAKKARSE